MNEAAQSPARKERTTAQDRANRQERIFARLQEGWSYEAIAGQEKLTRERIRQIVVDTLARRAIDPSRDHLRLQIARLDPALRLAAEQVGAGDLRAVDRLIRVLDRLDKYQNAASALGDAKGSDDAYQKLLAKLGKLVARREAAEAAKVAPARTARSDAAETPGGSPTPSPASGEAENAISRFFPPEVIENARKRQE